MHTLLAAPDKFRHTATAPQVAAAICRAADRAGWNALEAPMSDGGEGFLDIFGHALMATVRTSLVTGPLGTPVTAQWALARGDATQWALARGPRTPPTPYRGIGAAPGSIAVIEMARASGLELAGGSEANDPLGASTRGTGELIAAAIAAGARTIVVGCGGSATTDGGVGALEVLRPHSRLAGIDLVVAYDTSARFTEAADRFSAQKGATPAQMKLLVRRLTALAGQYKDELGVDVASIEGGGAAGGLAGGLAALGARLVSGFDLVADVTCLGDLVRSVDLVVTGEGILDAESLEGKVVGSMAALAESRTTPLLAVVGEQYAEVPFTVVSIVERFGMDRAMADTQACVEEAVAGYLAGL